MAMAMAVIAAGEMFAAPLMSAAGGRPNRDDFVKAWGVRPSDFPSRFSRDGALSMEEIACSADCNMALPGETVRVTVLLRNSGGERIDLQGRWIWIDETLVTRSADVFDLGIEVASVKPFGQLVLSLGPRTTAQTEVDVPLPETFGSGALLFERADSGVRLFIGHFARIIDAGLTPGAQTYQVCMDLDDPSVVARLHTAPNRVGAPYWPSDDPGHERAWSQLTNCLAAIRETGFPICVEWGAGPDRGPSHPLGRSRPHLDDGGVMLDTKADFAWLPAYDDDFKSQVKRLVAEWGWPKGPVNGLMLWNEPWNGISISGWGADDLRYREIYTAMCEGAEEAMRENKGVHVLLGGCDSSANTFDKLFPDGDMSFLPRLDFLSLHYQGLSPSNARFMRDRTGPNGRVRFWDTESWVANSPDRVPCVLAGMLAAGHDRIVGIQGHAVIATGYDVRVPTPDGRQETRHLVQAWPCAPALAAFQRFVGNRVFERLQWEGLPWAWRFRGDDPDDLTVVVCGDIAPAFDGKGRTGIVPFWTAREAAGGGNPTGSLLISGVPGAELFDGNGNLVARAGNDGALTIPLSYSGYYLRPAGVPGAAERLVKALDASRSSGMPPVAPVLRDATQPLRPGTIFRAELRNLLNRPLRGSFSAVAEGLTLETPSEVEIAANSVAAVEMKVVSGEASPANEYPFRIVFDAGGEGRVEWRETLHCNVIASRSHAAAAPFKDWSTPWPQTVRRGGDGATDMEKAWLPMLGHSGPPPAGGAAIAWVSADDEAFHFAAQIADSTPDPGMPRFETLDEDAYFYPAVAEELDREATVATRPATAPGGVEAWTSLADKMAFTLDAGDAPREIVLVLADDDGLLRRRYALNVSDAAGTRTETLAPAADRARVPVVVRGASRVELRTLNWLKPLIVAVEGLDGDPAWEERVVKTRHAWPADVRRYTYRRRPDLPQGATPAHDNVQIAFNVLPDDEKPWHPAAPGTFKGYAGYWDTDWEFALNPVAEAFGGGVEVWKCRAPGLPDKHYYPRSPKHPDEGPVRDASLRIWRDDRHRYVVASIPWKEIPGVRAARDEGRPIKFSFRVNDNGVPGACMELSCRRSVAKRNESFKPNWCEHWANEVEFGWERQ